MQVASRVEEKRNYMLTFCSRPSGWNDHTAIQEVHISSSVPWSQFWQRKGKSSKNYPPIKSWLTSKANHPQAKTTLASFCNSLSHTLWYQKTAVKPPQFLAQPPLLNISKCQSGFVSFIYTFESKSWFKFEFYLILKFKIWIWTTLNSNCHFFSFCCHWQLSSSLRLQSSMPHILQYARFAYMHNMPICTDIVICTKIAISWMPSAVKAASNIDNILSTFFHQCVANVQNAVFLQ